MTHVDPIPALKRQLGVELQRLLRDWNADDVAFIMGTDRWRIADLRRTRLERFSLERLIRFLARLDYGIVITVKEQRFLASDKSRPKE